MRVGRVQSGVIAVVIAVVSGLALAACGGSDGGSDAGSGNNSGGATTSTTTALKIPAECDAPPVVMEIEAQGREVAGGKAITVTDAVARRVAIVPKAKSTTPAELAAAKKKGATTPLAFYSLSLATFPIDRKALAGPSIGDVVPLEGETLGTVSFVPQDQGGFRTGDVATSAPLSYETTTTFTPVSAVVHGGPGGVNQAYTDVKGDVKILALDAKQICAKVDVTLLNGTTPVYVVKGTVLAPVVKADPTLFFT